MANDTPYTPEELAALEATAEKATPGKRTAVYLGDEATGVPITQPEMLDYVRRTIDISGGNAFHLVHVEAPNGGDPLDLCHTGNGRDSGANSQHIATFDRETCLRLIHQLRQQTARAEALEDKVADLNDEGSPEWCRLNQHRTELITENMDLKHDRDAWKARAEAAERALHLTEHARKEQASAAREAEQDSDCRRTMAVEEMKMRIAAEEALAAAEVERARLVAVAGAFFDKVVSLEKKIGSVTAMAANHGFPWPEGDTYNWTREREALRECLAASPHAELAAVRAVVEGFASHCVAYRLDMEHPRRGEPAPIKSTSCMGCEDEQDGRSMPGRVAPFDYPHRAPCPLAALPSWCREQP